MSEQPHEDEPGSPGAGWGRVAVVAAAVLWSTAGLFAKSPYFADWPLELRGPLLAFWRALFAGLALAPFVRRPRWRWELIPMTLAFAAMNYAYLTAMTLTTEANAIWLQNIAPVWVFLIGVPLLGERVRPGDWLLLLLVAAGLATILGFELAAAQPSVAGLAWGVASGATYAVVILSMRRLRDEDAVWLIALNHGVTIVCLAPVPIYAAATQSLWPTGGQLLTLAAFGALQMGLPYVLMALGLRSVSGHEAAGIALIEPVLVPVWVWLAWGAADGYVPPSWWTLVGGGLILVGLASRLAMAAALEDDRG